jgi:hypothetical protein
MAFPPSISGQRREPAFYRGLSLILVIQGLFFIFLVFKIPFHYDEAWSYMYFSGKGFMRTALFYPLPNNHILYNLMATVFVKLPIDPEIGTRLPSYFASFFATYYFYRLAYVQFSGFVTLIVTALFASAYPFVLYSIEARGYSFLIFCTVLMFYATVQLAENANVCKYRNLYWISLAAGLYTMPSFIYAVIFISGTLGLFFLSRREWHRLKLFLTDNLKAAAITVLVYAPVVALNGIQKFTHPDGFSMLSFSQLLSALPDSLSNSLHFLTGVDNVPLLSVLICAPAGILYYYFCGRKGKYLALLCAVVLLSPPVILFANPTLPDPRTWSYLVVPLMLSVGFLISLLTSFLTLTLKKWHLRLTLNWRWPAIAMALVILPVCYGNFLKRNRENYTIDYTIRAAFRNIGPDFAGINSIGYTGKGLEYYVAEDLQFQCMKRDRDKSLMMDRKGSLTGIEDALILAPDSLFKFRLDQYKMIGTDSLHYFLFVRLNKCIAPCARNSAP